YLINRLPSESIDKFLMSSGTTKLLCHEIYRPSNPSAVLSTLTFLNTQSIKQSRSPIHSWLFRWLSRHNDNAQDMGLRTKVFCQFSRFNIRGDTVPETIGLR